MRLLESSDPAPTVVQNAGADAPFLIICDHAGRAVPSRLGDLGLPPEAFERHIAWDLGAADLSLRLGAALGACVMAQAYSRLVIDCNRDPARPDAMPTLADGQPVPGNEGLAPEAAAARVAEIHEPYHAAIDAELDRRAGRGLPTRLLFVHSFTPRMAGFDRPWHFGVLHEGSSAFSREVLAGLRAEPGWITGDNEPYVMDEIDYSAPRHALERGLDYLELEVRQDLLAEAEGRARIAGIAARVIVDAARRLDAG